MSRHSREDRNQHSQQCSRRETSRAELSPILLYSSQWHQHTDNAKLQVSHEVTAECGQEGQITFSYWQCSSVLPISKVYQPYLHTVPLEKSNASVDRDGKVPAKLHHAEWEDSCSHATKGSRMRILEQTADTLREGAANHRATAAFSHGNRRRPTAPSTLY